MRVRPTEAGTPVAATSQHRPAPSSPPGVFQPVRRLRTRPVQGRSGGLGAAGPQGCGVEGAAAPGGWGG
ncbi:hypothetical protein STVIR_4668 [Streptomyces viridochromogenes Tue57]|uniref:Uncharacterized protein n=1 Tax=Streptomyces viridochromogenes Tue57 TaxID=1160705 RepID=L8PG52_STRVR|nr:hypothetical protein STVIR_4668 [Streptomyces viridochromogenes Tue57]